MAYELQRDRRWIGQYEVKSRLDRSQFTPYIGVSHHPILNRRIELGKSDVASFRRELFSELRHKRKFALRLGNVTKEGEWRLSSRITRRILKIRKWVDHFEAVLLQGSALAEDDEICRSELRE